MTKRYIRIALFTQETGYTDKAVRNKILTGVWLMGREYIKAPDGTIHMEMEAYQKWLESQR